MGNLYIMVGCPGSGKTTYARKNFPKEWYVSRDDIRFSLVSENEEYFSKEDEVFETFIKTIEEKLAKYGSAVADATHLNEISRAKLTISLHLPAETRIIVYFMRTSLEKCLERNENRKGTRSYVPREVIKRMYHSMTKPSFIECNGRIDIINTINN